MKVNITGKLRENDYDKENLSTHEAETVKSIIKINELGDVKIRFKLN